MKVSKYTSGDDFAHPDINLNSDKRIVFLSGLGKSMRDQGEPFIRRFALLNHISYLALDFDAITADKSEKENFGLETAFDRTMDKISKLKEEHLILTGSCFGGLMSYLIAQKFPDKVDHLILLSPLAAFDNGLFKHVDQVLTKRDEKIKNMHGDNSLTERMTHFHKMVLLAACFYGQIPFQSAYKGPIQIIHGEKDNLVPVSNSSILKDNLDCPDVSLQVIPGGKHNFDVSAKNKMRYTISALKKHLGR